MLKDPASQTSTCRICSSLSTLSRCLAAAGQTHCKSLQVPLQVKLQLLHRDIVMQPSAPEIRKAVAGIMSRLHETSQPFVRWMDGTCLEAAAVAGTPHLAVLRGPWVPV